MGDDPGGTFATVLLLSLFIGLVVRAFWREIVIVLTVICIAVVVAPIVMAAITIQNLRSGA